MTDGPHFAVICGMRAEAALLPAGVPFACSGGRPERALAESRRLLAEGAVGLLSFGIAGALSPEPRAGDLAAPAGVIVDGVLHPCDREWQVCLAGCGLRLRSGPVLGASAPVAWVADKSALYRQTGAIIADLESAAVALACAEAGKPFAILRAVADPASRAIPPAALVGLDEDGRTRPWAVLRALAQRPADLPGLLMLALETRAALRALAGATRRLGPTLGFEPGAVLGHQ